MTAQVRKCHKQEEFSNRIERHLGVSVRPVACYIVSEQGMHGVMRKSGWSARDAVGVVGFQVGRQVYVLDSAPWTVLHELVHRSGINADRINRYVAEGLTEAISEELSRSRDEHRPTYPQETRWVKMVLLPRLGMTAIQLGRRLAKSSDPPGMLADLMVRARPSMSRETLLAQLRPQVQDRPSFNRRGHVTRDPSLDGTIDGASMLAGVMIAGGVALLLPRVWS